MVRIRKNLKLSPLQNFPNVAHQDLQPHICKLNQSPWDYPTSSSSFDLFGSSPLLLQYQVGEGLVGNGRLGGSSLAALDSVTSPMDIDKANVAGDVHNYNTEKVIIVRCQRTDGKSWQCKKEAKEGFLLCDHHLKRTSTGVNSNATSKDCNILLSDNFAASNKNDNGVVVPAKNPRGRAKSMKKGAIANTGNPYEFYYYSGFGPQWGRNRNKKGKKEAEEEENEDTSNVEEVIENVAAHNNGSVSANTDPQPCSSTRNVGNGDQLDYMEDDFDDEDESEEEEGGGGCGPRRMRRPVKARSLMSIINVRAQ